MEYLLKMVNYLFISDSKFVISKLVHNLPNYYQDEGNLLRYEYKQNYIHINKFSDDSVRMISILQTIADLEFKFDKIFLLLGNITNHFKLYINGLAYNLVKSESDVIIFKLKSIKYDFEYIDNCMCCNDCCACCFGCKSYYEQSSQAIYIDIQSTDNLDYNPDYFINYLNKNKNTNLNKTIKSEKIIRDENISNDTFPIAIAEVVSMINTNTNTNTNQENINYTKINLIPSAPPL